MPVSTKTITEPHLVWRLSDTIARHYRVVNVQYRDGRVTEDIDQDEQVLPVSDLSKSRKGYKATDYILRVIEKHGRKLYNGHLSLRLLVSSTPGYVICSHTLQRRMNSSQYAFEAEDFVSCNDYVETLLPEIVSFSDILRTAVGGVVAGHGSDIGNVGGKTQDVDADLSNRLSSRVLVSPHAIQPKVIALVGCSGPESIAPYFQAAKDMNIRFIAIEKQGHWLQHVFTEHPVDAFIAMDMTNDEGFVDRLVPTLKKLRGTVHGCLPYNDPWMSKIAHAARLAGIHAPPAEALAISGDKHATRQLSGGCTTCMCSSMAEVEQFLRDTEPPYPMVVKPANGWGSGGVVSVRDEVELRAGAAGTLDQGDSVVIEPFIQGPEFDSNFFLWNSEVLFYELIDNFPTLADSSTVDGDCTFQETDMVGPTAFTVEEAAKIKQSMVDLVLQMGFTSGVFHTEGRVVNSFSEFTVQDGELDLHRVKQDDANLGGGSTGKRDLDVFALEVNTRSPGPVVYGMTERLSGVDWSTLCLLNCINDDYRAHALSQPFVGETGLHYGSVVFTPSHAGTFTGLPIDQDLANREPELTKHVVESACNFRDGDMVPGPPLAVAPYLGHFYIESKTSRSELLRLMRETRQKVRQPVTKAF